MRIWAPRPSPLRSWALQDGLESNPAGRETIQPSMGPSSVSVADQFEGLFGTRLHHAIEKYGVAKSPVRKAPRIMQNPAYRTALSWNLISDSTSPFSFKPASMLNVVRIVT